MSEWIEWKGGKNPPVDIKKPVDIKMKSGVVKHLECAIGAFWGHTGSVGDIVAYRIVKENK